MQAEADSEAIKRFAGALRHIPMLLTRSATEREIAGKSQGDMQVPAAETGGSFFDHPLIPAPAASSFAELQEAGML